MSNLIPKLNAIYYKNILENVLCEFFTDFNDSFIQSSNGNFVMSENVSKCRIKKYIKEKIVFELDKYITKYNISNPNYFFVIGSCFPMDNVLLEIKNNSYFPSKISSVIKNNPYTKYFLKESDIKIDVDTFNSVSEEIFDEFFRRKTIEKTFGEKSSNLFFIKNKNLDCLMTYRIMRSEFGRNNVINLHEKNSEHMKSVLHSINEIIDKYVHGKRVFQKSERMKILREIIVNHIKECIFRSRT